MGNREGESPFSSRSGPGTAVVSWTMRSRVVWMNHQLSESATSTFTPPFRSWNQHFGHVMARLEFASILKGSYS
jgi:hypothetical protein